jgi:hypothetical protein
MKRFLKICCVAAVALVMTTFGATQARAGGWAVAGGVLGGLAVGTAIGATVTTAAQPAYYGYPAPVYAAPGYYGPVASYAPVPAYCYGPRVIYGAPYAYYYPHFRTGYGWGPHYFRGRPYHRR